ncbi:MAG: diacylglycerol/lipid kinase family protein [Armatimonadota bacterium]
MDQAFLIVNPMAGRPKRGRRADELVAKLAQHGPQADLHVTEGRGHATELAREAVGAGARLVIVAGGDGTVAEVVAGLAGTDAALGVVPIGTGNVIQREYGLFFDWDRACEVIAGGSKRRVDVGRCGSRTFLLHMGVGHDAQVVTKVPDSLKGRIGQLAFVLAIGRTLAEGRQWEMRVQTDAGEWQGRAWSCVAANAKYFAWRLKMAPLGSMDSGRLEVSVFKSSGRLAFIGSYLRSLAGTHYRSPNVETLTARSITIETEQPAPVQMDGTVVGTSPISAEIWPRALTLIVPRAA